MPANVMALMGFKMLVIAIKILKLTKLSCICFLLTNRLHSQTSISTSAPEFAVLPALDVAMLGLTANIGKFSLNLLGSLGGFKTTAFTLYPLQECLASG